MVLGGILDITTLAGTGTGSTIVNDGLGNDLVLKDLINGTGVTFGITADDITINATAATLQTAYDASASPEIIVDATRGALTIQDNAVPIGANLFEVQTSGGALDVFYVDVSGATVDGKLNVTGLIDPTGLILAAQGALPGGTRTIWVDSADDTLKYQGGSGQNNLYEETYGPVAITLTLAGAPINVGPVTTSITVLAQRYGRTVTLHNTSDSQIAGSLTGAGYIISDTNAMPASFRPTTSSITAVPVVVYDGATPGRGTFTIDNAGTFTFYNGLSDGAGTGSTGFTAATANHGITEFVVQWNIDA